MIQSHRGLLSVAMNMSKLRCVSSGFTNEVLNEKSNPPAMLGRME